MGKKGSWFSAIRRVFTHGSKEKRADEPDKKNASKERKKGKGILRHGESKSFIPLFREPSSIEKILGEADQLLIRPPTPLELPKPPPPLPIRPVSPNVTSPRAASPRAPPPRAASSKAAPPPKLTQSRKETSYAQRPEPTLRDQQLSATKLQAAYRGYMARRSFRALKGLLRLQGVVKGQNVKRQTANAMKQMQLLVRVQTQIQSRRIHMLENQALQHQAYKNDKEAESALSKWTLNQLSEAGKNEDWDDSSVTKEEAEARLRKKVEAVVKREKAMAYAYSHQLWKSTPKSVQNRSDARSIGFPWWWNWLERQLPQAEKSQSQAGSRNLMSTPPRTTSFEFNPSPSPSPSTRPQLHASSNKLGNLTSDNHISATPRSSRSPIPFRAKQFATTPNRSPLARKNGANLKDDDSLVSCPPFSVPNYMTPTASARAKSRANSNPRERFPGTPGSDSKRRLSFPLTPNNAGLFKWNEGSNSIGDFTVNSAASTPAGLVGRRPFNRFV